MPVKSISHGEDLKSTQVRPGLTKQVPEHDPQEMYVAQFSYSAGTETKVHVHDEAEMAYVAKGKASLTIDDNPPETIEEGDFFYTAPGGKHGMKVLEDLKLIYFGRPRAAVHTHEDGKPHSH